MGPKLARNTGCLHKSLARSFVFVTCTCTVAGSVVSPGSLVGMSEGHDSELDSGSDSDVTLVLGQHLISGRRSRSRSRSRSVCTTPRRELHFSPEDAMPLPLPTADADVTCVLKGTASVNRVVLPDEPVCSCEFRKAMLLRDIVQEMAIVRKGIHEEWKFETAFNWCNSYPGDDLYGVDDATFPSVSFDTYYMDQMCRRGWESCLVRGRGTLWLPTCRCTSLPLPKVPLPSFHDSRRDFSFSVGEASGSSSETSEAEGV